MRELFKKMSNPSSLVCQLFENSLKVDQSVLNSFPEDVVSRLSRVLQLNQTESIILAYSLSLSQSKLLSNESIKFLKLHLPDITINGVFNELSDEIKYGLTQLIQMTEVRFSLFTCNFETKFNYDIP